MFRALGLVETLGSADAIRVVDALVKTADVEFQTWHTKCGGHTTVFVSGDVASVSEAIDYVASNPPCEIIQTAVVSNPSEEAERLVLDWRENSRFARAMFETPAAAQDQPSEKAETEKKPAPAKRTRKTSK